jgi:hypothetical protein
MSKTVFLASFPNNENIKDGMIQRVKHIDDLFSSTEREYLDISFRRHFKACVDYPSSNVTQYKFNAFLDFFKIWKLIMNSEKVYIHSIYRFFPVMFIMPFYKKNICLDVHGVVPEENKLAKGVFFYKLYSFIEYFAFKNITHVVFVTKSMEKHYSKKYNIKTIKTIVFNIYPNISGNLGEKTDDNSKTLIIYSGNAQKWQNVEDMLKLIQNNYNHNFEYLILTGEPDLFKRLLHEYNLVKDNIDVKSVRPDELAEYYRKANYGIILRDDILVNRVANPTKMIEYLMFGMIPVVRLKEIGDFYDMGYDFIEEDSFTKELCPVKSFKNVQIAQKISLENKEISIKNFLR